MKPLSFDAVAKTIALFDYKFWSLSIIVAPNRDSFVGSRNNETPEAAAQTLRDIAEAYPPATIFGVTFGREEKSNGGSKSQAIVFSMNPEAASTAQAQPAQALAGVVAPLPQNYVSRDDLDALLKRNQEMTEHRVRIANEEAELAKQRVALQAEIKAFETQKVELDAERKKYQEKFGHVKDAIDEAGEAAIPELLRSLQRMFTGGGADKGKTLAGAENNAPATEYDAAVDEVGAYLVNTYDTPEKLRKVKAFLEKMNAQATNKTDTEQ